MLLTDAGKLSRIHVSGMRIAGRNTQGVTLFKTHDSERVVSVVRLAEDHEIVGGNDEGEVSTATGEMIKGEGEANVR